MTVPNHQLICDLLIGAAESDQPEDRKLFCPACRMYLAVTNGTTLDTICRKCRNRINLIVENDGRYALFVVPKDRKA